MSALLSTRCISLASFFLWKLSTCPGTAGKIKWEEKQERARGTQPGTRRQIWKDPGLPRHYNNETRYDLNLERPLQNPMLKVQCLACGSVWRLWSVGGRAWLEEVVHWGTSLWRCCLPWLQPALSFLPELCDHAPTVNDWAALLCLSQQWSTGFWNQQTKYSLPLVSIGYVVHSNEKVTHAVLKDSSI